MQVSVDEAGNKTRIRCRAARLCLTDINREKDTYNMATEIKMPQLSDTMDSGKIISWNKKEGESVNRGDILAEVETDKANLEIESFHKGVLLKILVDEDQTAQVGETIAYVGEAGEAVGDSGKKESSEKKPEAEKQVTKATNGNGRSAHEPEEKEEEEAVTPPDEKQEQKNGRRVKASPLARKLAEDRNVDLQSLSGSGPGGRIIKKDVEASFASSGPGEAAPQAAPSEQKSEERPVQSKPSSTSSDAAGSFTPLSKMRATIARRMQEAVVEAPHFYTTTSVDMTEALKLRSLCKEREDLKGISINHLVIKAAAYGLTREPRVNGAMKNGQLYTPASINIGIVTALEEGLLIPVVRDANLLSLKDLAFEARAAIERARAGRPNSSDLSGGTFSISNMGMFDVENFTAIINPGQGAILAVSSVIETPVVRNGNITIASMMKVTLSVDHRIIDGVMAGNFLKAFREGLESPALLLMD